MPDPRCSVIYFGGGSGVLPPTKWSNECGKQAPSPATHPVALSRHGVRIVLKIEAEDQSDQQPSQTLHTHIHIHTLSLCLFVFFAVRGSSSRFLLALSSLFAVNPSRGIEPRISEKGLGRRRQQRRCDFFFCLWFFF